MQGIGRLVPSLDRCPLGWRLPCALAREGRWRRREARRVPKGAAAASIGRPSAEIGPQMGRNRREGAQTTLCARNACSALTGLPGAFSGHIAFRYPPPPMPLLFVTPMLEFRRWSVCRPERWGARPPPGLPPLPVCACVRPGQRRDSRGGSRTVEGRRRSFQMPRDGAPLGFHAGRVELDHFGAGADSCYAYGLSGKEWAWWTALRC